MILGFKGDYDQIPPMYSALKVDGKKLCDLARAGKEVERKARRVQILEISILNMELPRVSIRVTCSKGTYIRTLCDDIGRELGTGGCMEHLLRTRVDRFLVEDSLKLDEIEQLRDMDGLEEKNFTRWRRRWRLIRRSTLCRKEIKISKTEIPALGSSWIF